MAAKYRAGKARPTSSLEDRLAAHRGALTRRHRVRNADQLVAMVDELGFCFAFTESGDVPVPACFDHLSTNDQDRKWGWMWGWKDELAEAKRLYYGRLLAKKPTFVAMRMLPVFYATFGRAGEPDDHLDDIRAGRLSDVARRVVEFLAQRGETQTKRMRAELGISSQEGRLQYAKAPSARAARTTTTHTTSSFVAIPRPCAPPSASPRPRRWSPSSSACSSLRAASPRNRWRGSSTGVTSARDPRSRVSKRSVASSATTACSYFRG